MEVLLPDYLREIENINHYYGILKYEESSNFFIIEGEPIVCQMAKRLFPGCDGKGRNVAKFQANKRNIGDLNWLMMRYPLKIDNEHIWKREITQARAHVINRERINNYPMKVSTDNNLYFNAQLRNFQQEGLGFMLQNRRTLLADEMGLGKTVQALAFLSHTNAYPSILVVPPHLITNWKKEISKFLRVQPAEGTNLSFLYPDEEPRIHVIKGLKAYELPEADIYIIHYLLLRGWKRELPKVKFEAVIFDEIQELRHANTEKYSAASLLSESCDNVIGLSGTPIYNKGGEIWNVMNIIEYQCLRDWDSFTREWCYGYGNDVVADPATLGEYLKREGLLLRRTKQEVLKELPAKRRIVQHIDSDEKLYNTLILETVKKAMDLDNLENVFERGRLTREIIQEERQATGIAKAPFVCSFAKMLLEGEEKVLLFAYHHAVFDIYKEELSQYNPVFITGRETQRQKDESVRRFMEGETNICCISLRAAAGLNLQRASVVMFGELDWSPAVHSQAEDRAHRLGQKDSVLCYYLVASSGSDEAIQEALGLKVSQFVGLMGDRQVTEEDNLLAQSAASEHMKKIISKLKTKAS
jgi:SNF2 family DNA or RNA helicase